MQTLILNGSPRTNGDTKHMIETLCAALEGEKVVIDVYKANFTPCTDCRYCWNVRDCVFKDDLNLAYELLNTADRFIIASPLYFSELSGPLLSYVSRFQRYYAERYVMKDRPFQMKSKKGALLLAAGGSTKNFEKPLETGTLIARHVHTEIIGHVIAENTDQLPAKENGHVQRSLSALAARLNV